MLKRNQLYVSLFASSLVLLGSSVAQASESITSTASVTVQNAFDLTEVSPLSFGSIRATFVSGGQATIVLSPDGSSTATDGDSEVATLIPGQPAEFAIANASTFTPMTIELPDSAVNLVNTQASSQAARFTLSSFTMADSTNSTAVLSGAGATVTTDNTGSAAFLVGATLTTAAAPTGVTAAYVDGQYTGNFTITVKY